MKIKIFIIIYFIIYIIIPNFVNITPNILLGTVLQNINSQIILLSIPFIYLFKNIKEDNNKIIVYLLLWFFILSQIIFTIFWLPDNLSENFKKFFNLIYFQIGLVFIYSFFYWFKKIFSKESLRISFFKEKFKNRYFFYIWLFFVFLLNFIIKIYLSYNYSIDTDESYTWMVIEWYNKFWEINITPSWVYYDQTPLFHYLSAQFYNFFYSFWFNKILSLRSFNIIYSTILSIPLFIVLKNILWEKIGFYSFLFIIFNWYFLIIQFTARPYVTFLFFTFFSIISLFYSLKLFEDKKIKKWIIFFFLSFLLWLYNFLDWHIVWFYHYIIFLFIILIYKIIILWKIWLKIFWFALVLFIFLLSYLYFFKYSYIEFFFYTFDPFLKTNVLLQFWNFFSYLWIIWNTLIILSFLLIYRSWIKYSKLFTISLLFIIVFHIYFFSSRLWFIKYISDLYIFISIFIIIFLFNLNKNNKILFILFLSVFSLSTWTYYLKIKNDNISWWVMDYKEDKKEFFEYCSKNWYVNILTDSPSLWYFYNYKNNISLYSLKPYNNGDNVELNWEYKYKYLENILVIDNIEDFKTLNEKWNICFIFTHNSYDYNNRFSNEIFFQYIINNWKIIKEEKLTQNLYDLSYFEYFNNHNWTIITFDKK